jgi:hypothetical protein
MSVDQFVPKDALEICRTVVVSAPEEPVTAMIGYFVDMFYSLDIS